MGVPAFFRWLCRKYPTIVVQCHEEPTKKDPTTDEKIPIDTSKANPNGIEFDNLYLDMNGIIHPCTHPEDRPAPKNEDEMMLLIFEFIDRIFAIVRPRKLLYMAIDGVAPRAKMNQQRSRRFRAAKEGYEKTAEIKRLKEQIMANGGQVPPDVPHSEKFDSNCITPGTPFMFKLAECLRYYVHDRLNHDPGWAGLTVILSDANVPGEGEHKIMDYIRRQRANPNHDPNTHHVLCGADADLIMLGLATHEPNFSIIREEFRADRPRPCEICNQFGHDTKECCGIAREKSGAHDEMANAFVPTEQRYIFLRLSILREYLHKELYMENMPFKFDIERAIDDWVFMCFFVGNDFLPHLPSLEIREGAIDRLVRLYKAMISQATGYLTDCGEVNLDRVQIILKGIGQVEDDIFKKRQRQELEFRQRAKDKKKRMRSEQDGGMEMPAWMKTGPYAPQPLGRKPNPVSTANRFEQLEKKETSVTAVSVSPTSVTIAKQTNVEEETKRVVKRKHDNDDDESKTAEKADDSIVVPETEEEPDEDANDPVRLWEDGWKERYYKIKFDVDENDFDFRQAVSHHYTIGLQWVLKYYYQGVPAWNWYFPYHYAPFASDFTNITEAYSPFDEPSEPFKPFEQLMAVFPAASRKHVPGPWQILMTDKHSPIIDFYPDDFQVDLNGKKQSWQGVALLPFVDEARLKQALVSVNDKLSPLEKKRNTRGNDRLFVAKSHTLFGFMRNIYESNVNHNLASALDVDTQVSGGIAGKIWRDEHVCLDNEVVKSPLGRMCEDIEQNQVISVCYHDPVYADKYVFKSNILQGAKIPDSTLKPEDLDSYSNSNYRPNLGYNRNNDYRPNKNAGPANRMIQNSMRTQQESVVSSAYGGHGSLYGSYKSSSQQSISTTGNAYSNNNNNNNSSSYNNSASGGASGSGGYSNVRYNYQQQQQHTNNYSGGGSGGNNNYNGQNAGRYNSPDNYGQTGGGSNNNYNRGGGGGGGGGSGGGGYQQQRTFNNRGGGGNGGGNYGSGSGNMANGGYNYNAPTNYNRGGGGGSGGGGRGGGQPNRAPNQHTRFDNDDQQQQQQQRRQYNNNNNRNN